MGQDWGGRRPVNPPGAPIIKASEIYELATRLFITVRRGDFTSSGAWLCSDRGIWWYEDNGKWFTLGATNYVAYNNLLFIDQERNKYE